MTVARATVFYCILCRRRKESVAVRVFIWYHLVYFLVGRFKNRFFAGFQSPVFNFTYLQTWDAPARVREYPIKLFNVESLGLRLGFWGLNSYRPSQNPIFGGAPEKTPVGTRLKPSSTTTLVVCVVLFVAERATRVKAAGGRHTSASARSNHCS